MIEENFPIKNEKQQQLLKQEIVQLEKEISGVEEQIRLFENMLRLELENELIEVQELTVIYKKLQKEKKEKRFAQKKRGKNYQEIEGLKPLNPQKNTILKPKDEKEKKRLYREAMVYVHPDKFSSKNDQIDLATEVTSKLITIYKTGTLEELQIYYNHILSGNALQLENPLKIVDAISEDLYFENQLEKLKEQLLYLKNKQTYIVLISYENPFVFLDELKAYYADRIFKLKKRTRKAR